MNCYKVYICCQYCPICPEQKMSFVGKSSCNMKKTLNMDSYFQNSVTMLDVSSKQLFGPAYSGRLLGSLEHTAQHMQSDQSLMLLLQTIAAALNEKLFMYLMLLKKKLESAKAHSRPSLGSDVLKDLGLDGCDAEIVRYLSKVGSINWIPVL